MVKKKSGKGRKIMKKTSNKSFPLMKRRDVALKSFIFFAVLFGIFLVFYYLSINELFKNFFEISFVIFGFLALAFLISFIILTILKSKISKSR